MNTSRGYYDVFVRTCAKSPAGIAVRHYDNGVYKNYTYSELYGVCEYISQILQQLDCSKGIIGLISERNIIIPCVIAAAHKCCTTFMFMDPSQNVENIVYDVKFAVVITITENEAKTNGLLSKKPEKSVSVFNLCIDFFTCDTSGSSIKHLPLHSFIAMTSGSTGEPKHVQVPIQCIQPNIDDLTKLFNITPSDVIYFSTPLTFDPSMVEILLACKTGASLLIAPPKADVLFPENDQNSITFWQTTPSKFFQFSNADIRTRILSAGSSLKILALGGEPLNGIKRLKELKDWQNNTKIYTLYGVTEMSCWACAAELDLDRILTDREVPLGNCLSETQLVVEPEEENKYIGKILLASQTRQCIILNKPVCSKETSSMKFIDTGDIGEIKNGTIYYRGRKDDIIKRFGHKVNLQSIESTIMQCPKVKTCSCVWLPKPMLLVVYFSSETLSTQELSDFLKCKLDDKHWPDNIVRVDNLPTNPHGKISKALISKMYENMSTTSPPTIDTMKFSFLKELKSVLSKNFTYDQIKNKDFYAIGGTSFLAVSICNKLSHTSPRFSKVILPYLVGKRCTIGEIMQLAEKELHQEDCKPKRRTKRSRSNTESFSESLSIKKPVIKDPNKAIEFIPMWSYDTGKCVDASPTLFQTGFNLYVAVGSHSGKIVVIDAISGALQGLIMLKSRVEASVLCYEEAGAAPQGVVGAYDGTIVCFKLEDCHILWRINVNSMVKSKATICNGYLYVAAYDGYIRCINALSGEIKQSIHVADQAVSADLVLAKKQYVLLGTLSGVCGSIHTDTNTVAWRGMLSSPVFASPVLYDEDKYVVFAEVNGEIHCRTVEKGIKIWKYQGARGNIFSSLYIKVIEKLKWQMVFGCHDNKVYSITIKNFQPTLHWKAHMASPVYSTPCGMGDKFLVAASNNGKISIIHSESGTIVAEYNLPNEIFSSPAVYSDYIFIGCRNDLLYSLRFVLDV